MNFKDGYFNDPSTSLSLPYTPYYPPGMMAAANNQYYSDCFWKQGLNHNALSDNLDSKPEISSRGSIIRGNRRLNHRVGPGTNSKLLFWN